MQNISHADTVFNRISDVDGLSGFPDSFFPENHRLLFVTNELTDSKRRRQCQNAIYCLREEK